MEKIGQMLLCDSLQVWGPFLRLRGCRGLPDLGKDFLQESKSLLVHPGAVRTVNEGDHGVAIGKGAVPSRGVPGGLGTSSALQMSEEYLHLSPAWP